MSVIRLTLPERWQAMTPDQLLLFSRLSLNSSSPTELKCRLAIELNDLKLVRRHFIPDVYEFKKGGIKFNMDADLFSSIVSKLDFLDTPPENISPPAIKGFRAPDSRLYGVVLEQWFIADSYFAAYTASNSSNAINCLVAALYFPPGHKWVLGTDVQALAIRFTKVPAHVKHLVYLWYYSAKLMLMQKYWYVFNSSDQQSNAPADEIVMATIGALNGGNVANNDKVKLTEVHEALFELNRLIEISKNKKHV